MTETLGVADGVGVTGEWSSHIRFVILVAKLSKFANEPISKYLSSVIAILLDKNAAAPVGISIPTAIISVLNPDVELIV